MRLALSARESKDRDDWQFFRAQALLGASLARKEKYADAEPLLLSGYEGMNRREAAIPVTELRRTGIFDFMVRPKASPYRRQ